MLKYSAADTWEQSKNYFYIIVKPLALIYLSSPMLYFYTPWKRQKTFGFLRFLGGIEMEYWAKMD